MKIVMMINFFILMFFLFFHIERNGEINFDSNMKRKKPLINSFLEDVGFNNNNEGK